MRSDLDYFEEKMNSGLDSFTITELSWPTEGGGSKADRVQRLYPDFAHGKFFLVAQSDSVTSNQRKMIDEGQPWRVLKPTKRRDHEGNVYSLNEGFLQEYLVFPFSIHDDLLDACSRLYDMDYIPPIVIEDQQLEPEAFND